jgi:NAD(P)-dependent dehydrogenase (short-subunit alcohol dehydrogenase family)
MPTAQKTAIVTGASRGIGRAIAIRLARDAFRTVLCARDTAALGEARQLIESQGAPADIFPADLRLPETPARLANFALERTGRIDVVVNNAGATKRGDFLALTDDEWSDGFALKFFGAVRLTRAAWRHLKASAGTVVFISGVGGRTPGAEFTIGGSVNAALLSLTKALADLGIRDGIRVNAVNPGTIRTQRFQTRLDAIARTTGLDVAAAEQKFVREAGINRIGEPEDIANLVAFAVSPENSLLHGAILDLDGGATKTI